MKRRSFLAWVAGLPFMGRLFSKPIVEKKGVGPKIVEIETLLDFATGRLRKRLLKDFSKKSFIVDTAFKKVERESTCDYTGADFESLLFSIKEMRDYSDGKEMRERIDVRMTAIAKCISFLVSVDETPDFLVRLFELSIERLSNRTLELGINKVSKDDSTENCLILRWSLSVKSGSSFWLKDSDLGFQPMIESSPERDLRMVEAFNKPVRLRKR